MRRKRRIFQHSNTQGYPLREHIGLHHPLVELADMIDWEAIDQVATEPFQPGPGRPILRPWLVAGILYLRHAFDLSDEKVVAGWLERANWQAFTGTSSKAAIQCTRLLKSRTVSHRLIKLSPFQPCKFNGSPIRKPISPEVVQMIRILPKRFIIYDLKR